ncbi:DsbA family protein [Defluviimonas aestuarii]|uniref:DsbA family protein n=1 Tax=Albidovulum aestuarii TaxID=1130726 RepID=UPI00249C71AA|nr:DsbA family protein [Defluviimonas aestuarii]MDI3338112.1 DsbA family protein [Defluviimonas aestuarii]
MSKTYLIAGAVALVAAAGGAFWMTRDAAQTANVSTFSTAAVAQTATDVQMVPDMVLGQAEAPIEVIEYASFTCPHCANFHETAFDQLKANYIDTGKIRFVYREVYFDKFGLWAATVARCGGEEKYFGISDIIYDTQKTWIGDGDAATIADNLKKIGLKAGLSAEAVDACMRDEDQLKAMIATYQTNATKDEINSTPSFVIDGEKYSNMSYEDFAKILDEKLAN